MNWGLAAIILTGCYLSAYAGYLLGWLRGWRRAIECARRAPQGAE